MKVRRSPLYDAIALSIVIVGGSLAGSAYAQQASQSSAQTPTTLDNVIVTGTRRTGMQVDDSPAPIQVVTAEALQESGSPDLMNQLAFQVPSFNASQQGTDMASATLVASMRALSPNHTLVLVNGKRRHFTSNVAVLGAYAGAASADLSFIPTSAIASTEVLTDGAAALYGSDAIAGVVNFITKKDGAGGSVRAGVSGYDAGGGFTTNYQGNVGFGSDNGYFNVAIESERRETINRPGGIHGAATCVADYLAGTGCGPNGTPTASGYTVNTTANLNRENEYNMAYHPWFPWNQRQGDPPELERDIGFFSAGLFINDTTELYATGSFGKKSTSSIQSYRRPSQDGGVDLNGDGDRTDFISGLNSPSIVDVPVLGPRSGQPLTEADINKYPVGFNPNIETTETDYSFSVGLAGELSGWSYDLSTVYGKNEMEIYNTNSMNFSLWNEFGWSPEEFYVGRFTSSQWTTSLNVSRELDWGLVYPATFAAGLEYREDTYGIGAGDTASYYGGGVQAFPGYSPGQAGDYSRDAMSAYVNVIFNPTEKWLVDLAARYEDYSDFGGELVGKITTRYDFTDTFALRGTVSTGFRAPTMGEQYYQAISVGPTSSSAIIPAASVGGLDPETSTNISIGFVWKPLPNLTTTVDAYQIRIDDRTRMGSFAYSTSQGPNTLTGRTGGVTDPSLPDPADTNGDGTPDDAYNQTLGEALVALGFIGQWDDPRASAGGSFAESQRANINLNFFNNVLDTKTTGVDIVTTYNSEFNWGRVDWILAANYNKTEVTRAGTAAGFESIPLFNAASIWGIEENSPEWRLNLGATIHFSDSLSLNIRENIYGPQSTIASATTYLAFPEIYNTLDIVEIGGTPYYKAEIDTIFTTNVELAYRPLDGWRISVGADNLFDAYPDKTPQAILDYNAERYNTGGSRDYLLGSPLGFYGRRWFAKVSYEW